MGKNLVCQARGKGGPRYTAPSFNYAGSAKLKHLSEKETLANGTIIDIIKCPGHTAPLIKVAYADGEEVLDIAAEGVKVGDTITAGVGSEIKQGNTLPLGEIPVGTMVYNLEASPGDGGKFCRASGVFARVLSKTEKYVVVELPSKKERTFVKSCRANVGVVAGGGRTEKPLVKAGTNHHKKQATNKLYPHVCGQSMNAVDHPHGGSRSSKKNYSYTVSRDLPPGAKVGLIAARRSGRKKR
jgi:large subunit ribosomal protein L2